MTVSITEFIAARLDEDAALATAAANDSYGEDCWFDSGNEHIVDHYLRHGTARVLREVAAKRAILTDHLEDHIDHDCADHLTSVRFEHSGCYAIGQFAAIHADHPDYNPAWSIT